MAIVDKQGNRINVESVIKLPKVPSSIRTIHTTPRKKVNIPKLEKAMIVPVTTKNTTFKQKLTDKWPEYKIQDEVSRGNDDSQGAESSFKI